MTVVSDSSPLIALSRVGCFRLLPQLFETVHIPTEVYGEVVVAGARLPGAEQVDESGWVKVAQVEDSDSVQRIITRASLGAGEAATIRLALERRIGVVLIDERRARREAERAGLIAIGCLGILEALHKRGALADIRDVFVRLLAQDFRIDRAIPERILHDLQLPPLS